MARILLTQAIHPRVQARLAELGDVRVAADTSADTLRHDAAGCSVVVVRAPLPDDIFDAAPSLVGAVRHGAGVDMIPVEAATARGALVANVPGANAHTVAEHVLWSLLHLARRRGSMQARFQSGAEGWAPARAVADLGFELPGRTIGLVGFGHVGQAIARLCSGLQMHVLAHSRSGPRTDTAAAEHVPLRALLSGSDFVVLACPLTAETRGLIGAEELAAMRPGAFLVNVARGPVVQEAALIDALRSGHLAGAALDVFDVQPLRAEHPFRRMEQVLLTPHVAGITEDSMLRMGQGVVLAVGHLLRGDMPPNCINPQAEAVFRLRTAGWRRHS
jgi:D-3-phosphoglycerate dehydrogenase / 2-oxoglutarate reductase